MSFSKYFSNGQKVFIKRRYQNTGQKTIDTLTSYVNRCQNMLLDLALPYGIDAAESYPFQPNMIFEIMTDHRGMGLRLTASFVERLSSKDIRLQFEGNLEFISRRSYRRLDVNTWVGYQRATGNLAKMRQIWEENLQKIDSGVNPETLTSFSKYPLNLAGGGIRMPLNAPAQPSELILLFLSIGDKQGIICTLAEVVWVGEVQDDRTLFCGLRFLNIRENDQTRIDTVVRTLLKRVDSTIKK